MARPVIFPLDYALVRTLVEIWVQSRSVNFTEKDPDSSLNLMEAGRIPERSQSTQVGSTFGEKKLYISPSLLSVLGISVGKTTLSCLLMSSEG